MKFSCICGFVIRDNTDYQENKAYFIPDQTYEGALTEIEQGKSAWDALRQVKRLLYQCHDCARLWVEDQNWNLHSFAPDEKIEFGILKGPSL